MTDHVAGSAASRLGSFLKGRTIAHLLFAAACVGLADWLFYGHPVGWTLGVFGMLSGAGVALLGDTRFTARPAVLLGACFFGLCLRAIVDPDPFPVFMALVIWVALTLTLRGGWTWRLSCWIKRGAWFSWGLVKSVAITASFLVVLPLAPVLALLWVKRLRTWLIPFLLGLVFLGLFALANPVISLALTSVRDAWMWLYKHMPSFLSAPRFFFWLTIGAWLWTLLRHCTRDRAPSAETAVRMCPKGIETLLTKEVIRNALIVFNALFAVQTALDLWYLWGGGTLPQAMTYAEYAQRGAYSLVCTALLAAGFVLVTFREGSAAAENKATRCLVYAWLIQNVFLVVSAGWRLWLYIGVFSLSRLRLVAGVWMALVIGGLVWIVVRIISGRSNLWLIKVNFVTVAVVLLCYCWSFPNMLIASFNVRHCREAGCSAAQPVDLPYLSTLGYDALPSLLWLEKHAQGSSMDGSIKRVIYRLTRHLNDCTNDWRGMTPKRRYVQACLKGAGRRL